MTTTILYALQGNSREGFDETAWKMAASSHERSLFHSEHERDGRYFNPWMPMPEMGISRMLKWRFSGKPVYSDEEKSFLPEVKTLTADYINNSDNFIVWLGHASMLIKASGKVFMIDPVFGEIPFVKKRRVPSALSYKEASKISGEVTVLLTHNHYDRSEP